MLRENRLLFPDKYAMIIRGFRQGPLDIVCYCRPHTGSPFSAEIVSLYFGESAYRIPKKKLIQEPETEILLPGE